MSRPPTSRTVSTKAGSGDSLKVSARGGGRPKARQIRATMVWLIPARFAMARVDQGVAPSGLGLQRERDQASDLLVPDLARSPRAGRVRPSLQPMRRKAGPPRGHARTADPKRLRHARVGGARLGPQASTMRARGASAGPVR